MLQNLLGIRLLVLIGDTVPLPAPYEVSSALQQVEVTNDSGQGGNRIEAAARASRRWSK